MVMNNTNIAVVLRDINLDKVIQIVPTSTPTPTKAIIIKPIKDLEIIPLVTNKPTATPTATPTDKVVVVTATPTTKQEVTVVVSPTPMVTVAPKNGIENNQVIWFMTAIIGILVIIVLAQSWPKKEDETPEQN
jgi:hypothetical protein